VAGLQFGKIGVETIDECDEVDTDVLLDGGGRSQLSRTGKSEGGSLSVNDEDGPIRRVSPLPRYGLCLDGTRFGRATKFEVGPPY